MDFTSSGNTFNDPYDTPTDRHATCFDIDECANLPNGYHRHRCNSLASCHNNEGKDRLGCCQIKTSNSDNYQVWIGSYTCECVDGYEGNGRGYYGCADINEW